MSYPGGRGGSIAAGNARLAMACGGWPSNSNGCCWKAEYGRLVKTIYILRYYNSLDHRRRVKRQLNKGEAVQGLRRFLVVARQGELRQRYQEGLENQASCLTLVTNAVVIWNTVYLQAALDYIEKQGYEVTQEDRARFSPARYGHINPHGKIIFDIEKTQALKGLRPLKGIKKAKDA